VVALERHVGRQEQEVAGVVRVEHPRRLRPVGEVIQAQLGGARVVHARRQVGARVVRGRQLRGGRRSHGEREDDRNEKDLHHSPSPQGD
jgi:hypothetical protein